ncbi:MAG: hypothetical protein NUW01_11370 [Gemmatimonadaceae bacterium]|nr:hypothetical protein [Gemmatimonadaceae bacterium]
MNLLKFYDRLAGSYREVASDNPLPVAIDERQGSGSLLDPLADGLPPVAGRTVTRVVQVPGIGTGSAYAAGDAFGTLIEFPNVFRPEKRSGIVVGAFLIDLDNEGVSKDVPLFVASFTATADNSAFAPSANTLQGLRGFLSISSFSTFSANQVGQAVGTNVWIGDAPGTSLFTQLVTRGADNIAAGALPLVGLVVIPD